MIVLHILLLLLKIIGILLLIILGLLLIVLLVPIRYGFDVAYEQGGKPQANVRVTWFTKLLQVKGGYNGEGIYYNVKLAWKTLVISEEEEEAVKEGEIPKAETDEKKPETGETSAGSSEAAESVVEASSETTESVTEASSKLGESPEGMSSTEGSEAKADAEEKTDQRIEEDSKSISDKKEVDETGAKAKDKEAKEKDSKKKKAKENSKKKVKKKNATSVKEATEEAKPGILDKLNKKKEFVRGKMEQVRELYKEYRVGELLPFVKKLLISIIKHVIPRSLTGHAAYGFADPALTGQITGYAAMFYPLYAKSFTLSPNFCGEELDVALDGKGRIRLGFFVWILIRVLLNRHVWHDIILILKR